MKKRGLYIGLSIFFLLCGCSQNSDSAVISESVFEVPETDVVGGVEQIRDVETFSGTALEEVPENGEISGFINAMEKLSVLDGGMLYDFDFDNIPEIVAFDYGMEDTFYRIFKYSGGEFLYLGEMRSCDECLFLNDRAHVDLYHDKSDDFFYCASSVGFVKNNGEEVGVYGFNEGNLYRYEFKENEMTESVEMSFWENSDDEEALEAYLQDCKNALSQFELTGSAVFEPLWTGADIRDGTYRDIVRYELENRYNELKKMPQENTDSRESDLKPKRGDNESYTSCDSQYGEGIEKIFEIIDRTGSSGFLYDFDMDGVPEAAVKFRGVNLDYYYEIYDCGSGMLMGTVSLGAYEEDWLVSPQLTKYYDKEVDRYFYAADRDFWHKGYHYATAERYEFENDSITSVIIAQCKFDYTVGSGELNFTENELLGNKTTPMGIWKTDDIDCYYDGTAEYLAGFEKISVVDETPLWNEGQARSGEYKEIIAGELGKYSEN